jgi:Spy/CpxP family protein refolding chaperone
MKNVATIIKCAALASAIVMTSITTYASAAGNVNADNDQRKHHITHDGKKMKRHFKRIAKQLDLTQEQKDKIQAIYAEKSESRALNKETMQAFRQQVKALIMSPTFDEKAFLDLHNQQQSEFSQMALSRAKAKHAVMLVLTADQQEKMIAMKSKRRGMFR